MAVLLSRAHERRSREIRARTSCEAARKIKTGYTDSWRFLKLLPPQSPCNFYALARLYYLARPTKTAMLRRLFALKNTPALQTIQNRAVKQPTFSVIIISTQFVPVKGRVQFSKILCLSP